MAGLLVGGLLLVGCDPSPTLPPAEPIVPPPPRPPPTLERRVASGEIMFEIKFGPVMPRIQLSDDEVEALALYLECRSSCEGACWPACDGVDHTAESRGWWHPGVGEVF